MNNHKRTQRKMLRDQHGRKMRSMLDTLGRSNENKRGPKTGEDIEPVGPTSRLKKGVTVAYSRNVITLPDGTQCREGSLTHLNFINNN